MAGRTVTDRMIPTFGIAFSVASTFAEAEWIMNHDPAVKHGVMRAELFPYRVALWSQSGPSPEPAPPARAEPQPHAIFRLPPPLAHARAARPRQRPGCGWGSSAKLVGCDSQNPCRFQLRETNGVTNFPRALSEFLLANPGAGFCGSYDIAEERHVRRALARAGVELATTRRSSRSGSSPARQTSKTS